ncbi:MAG: hypothetical protein AB7O52_02620 [Planctomycetota bacterium]
MTKELADADQEYLALDGEYRTDKRAEVGAWNREVKIAREAGLAPRAYRG